MSRKPSPKQWENTFLASCLFAHYQNIGTAMYKWDGLPEYINPKYPEQTLYEQGMAVLCQPPNQNNLYLLPVKYNSVTLDPYGDPNSWSPYAVAGTKLASEINGLVLDADNSVLIWNDPKRRATFPYVREMVHKLVNLEGTLDTNTLVQQFPIIFNTSNAQLLDSLNLYRKIVDREPMVFRNVDYRNGEMPIEVFNPGVPFLGAELSTQYMTYDNRILEYLGVEHIAVEKNERLLTGEVDVSGTKCSIIRKARLDQRKRACENIRKVFGLKVTVEYDDSEVRRLTQGYGGSPNEQPEGNPRDV